MATAALTSPKPAPAKRARKGTPAAAKTTVVETATIEECPIEEIRIAVVETFAGIAEQDDAPDAELAEMTAELDAKPAPLTKPLWRYRDHAERRALLERFVGLQVMIETWPGRIGAKGDNQYRGTLVAVALSTTGTTADFAILTDVAGSTWALSTAQIHFVQAR